MKKENREAGVVGQSWYSNEASGLNDPENVSVIDDLSLWAAPFGLRLLEAVRLRRGISVLDIGSGLGFPLTEISMRLGDTSTVVGIDPWKTGNERASKKIEVYRLTHTSLVEGFAESMPFRDMSFDLIVSNNGINNVRDIGRTFGECNRVAKHGAEFIFTFNTDKTFVEFYDVFRMVLREMRLDGYEKDLDDHIYRKRKPVAETRDILAEHGFEIKTIWEDRFDYRFVDGTSMFRHFFIRMAFLESWEGVLPADRREKVFTSIEEKLNETAGRTGAISFRVPFVIIDCVKSSSRR